MLWSLPTQITSWLASLSKPWTCCSMLRTVLSLTFFRCPVHAVFKPRVHHHSLCDCYGSGSIPQATFYLFAHLCVWSHYSCTYLYPTSCLSTCCKELSTNLPEQLLPYQPHYLLLPHYWSFYLLEINLIEWDKKSQPCFLVNLLELVLAMEKGETLY